MCKWEKKYTTRHLKDSTFIGKAKGRRDMFLIKVKTQDPGLCYTLRAEGRREASASHRVLANEGIMAGTLEIQD